MGREIINARERVGEQAKWTFFCLKQGQGLKALTADRYFTLSAPPPALLPPLKRLHCSH